MAAVVPGKVTSIGTYLANLKFLLEYFIIGKLHVNNLEIPSYHGQLGMCWIIGFECVLNRNGW